MSELRRLQANASCATVDCACVSPFAGNNRRDAGSRRWRLVNRGLLSQASAFRQRGDRFQVNKRFKAYQSVQQTAPVLVKRKRRRSEDRRRKSYWRKIANRISLVALMEMVASLLVGTVLLVHNATSTLRAARLCKLGISCLLGGEGARWLPAPGSLFSFAGPSRETPLTGSRGDRER